MSETRVLHLDWSPGLNAFWIHRVLSALHACKSPILVERRSRWDRDPLEGLTLGDVAMAVGTKLTMVPLIIQRVDSRLKDIGKVLQADPSKVEACLRSRAVYRLPDCDAAHEAAIDFDSFIFESRSAYEITVSFLERFFNLILGRALGPRSGKHAAKHVEERLRARGARTEWVNDLRQKRNLLIHARSMWLAFEVRDGQPFRFDPVLLTKSVERIVSFRQACVTAANPPC